MFGQIIPRYESAVWPVETLINLYKENRLDLSPYYQRNSIWSAAAQRQLIRTIHLGEPMPNFFVRNMPNDKFEMVDGQQRSRTIIGYWNGAFADENRLQLNETLKNELHHKPAIHSYLGYSLSVTVLNRTFTNAEIEDFYVLVNSSGVRLNRPELRKADYHSSRFLKLATELAGDPLFEGLLLFTDQSTLRMNDIDFVSELIVFLLHGFTDKKEKVDEVYASDLDDRQCEILKEAFLRTLGRIEALSQTVPINKTRFKQKGDFYTLFAFVANNFELDIAALQYYFAILLKLSPHIRPSQEECDPLRDYAINCVTQSNSKKAREGRNYFFDQLFLNKSTSPNPIQSQIAAYLRFSDNTYTRVDGFLTLDLGLWGARK